MDPLAKQVAHRFQAEEARDQARVAKDLLRAQIGRPAWLRGVGLGVDETGTVGVHVNVASLSDEVQKALPPQINGVPVRINVVGDISPQPAQ